MMEAAKRRRFFDITMTSQASREQFPPRRVGAISRNASRRIRFVTDMIEAGYDIRTVQERLGHKDVSTTMIDTDILNERGQGVKSPLDD